FFRSYKLCVSVISSPRGMRRDMVAYLTSGFFVCVAGFSFFPIDPAKFGINNRAAIAGSVGVATSIVGLITFAGSFGPYKSRRIVFSSCVALVVASGVLIINGIATFWIKSYRQQLEILVDIQERVQPLSAGMTLLLDGICPYAGPAVVFDSE